MNIANQGFPATRADLNNALQALVSNSSGTSAPSTTFANQWWYDTTNNKLYIRNEANNAWIEVAVLDQTNNEWQITTGVVKAKDGDGLVFQTDDGTARLSIEDSGNVTINDGSANVDFRVESDGDTHALFLDGETGAVQMGGSSDVTGDLGDSDGRLGLVNTGNGHAGVSMFRSDTSITSSNVIGKLAAYNNDTTSNAIKELVKIEFTSDGSFAAGDNPTRIEFFTTQDATDTIRSVAKFDNGGTLKINRGLVCNDDSAAATNADVRMESDGNSNQFFLDTSANAIGIGTTNMNVIGNNASGMNLLADGMLGVSRDGTPLKVNKLSDGNIVEFYSAAGREGIISISGSTTTYGGFSGQHETSGIATNTDLGTVVSTIDELDIYPDLQDGEPHPKAGQNRADHAKVKVSNTTGDVCVYGVVAKFDDDGKALISSVGIGSVKVTGACANGDLLESNGDGTAKVQSDDIIRSKTIGKVTIGNSNTGVKLVSCVMYCG